MAKFVTSHVDAPRDVQVIKLEKTFIYLIFQPTLEPFFLNSNCNLPNYSTFALIHFHGFSILNI